MRLVLLLFFVPVILVFPVSGFSEHHTNTRLISVTGNAEVKVVPDEVVFTLGVETLDKKLLKAKNENTDRVNRIVEVTKKYNIDSKHVQTDYLSVEPQYDNSKYSSAADMNIDGYLVRNTMAVTLKDLSKFDSFYNDALEAGANYVHGVDFRTTELRKHRDEARSLAVKAAREKATALAAELGLTLGKPYSIQENQSGWWSGYNSWWGGRWGGSVAQNVVQHAPDGINDSDNAVALGQIKVNASVSVSFELQ